MLAKKRKRYRLRRGRFAIFNRFNTVEKVKFEQSIKRGDGYLSEERAFMAKSTLRRSCGLSSMSQGVVASNKVGEIRGQIEHCNKFVLL